jgi:hypothetical protein
MGGLPAHLWKAVGECPSPSRLRSKVCPGRRIGKAGVIEHPDGRTYSFVGSVNDSASGFRHAYEIPWGDDEPGAADWVRDEFEHFWAQGVDLPDAVVKHVAAMASRIEYRSIEAARDAAGNIPADDARSRITRQLISC